MKIKNIKFKAKQLNSGKWFDGDLVRLGNRVCIGGDHIKDGITEVDPSTVCMFTGLTDCEGNEVWEGDVVEREIFDLRKGTAKVKAVIVYMDGAFVAVTNGIPYSLYNKYIKVVCNIFDKEK